MSISLRTSSFLSGVFLPAVLLLSGCDTLPDGEPPQGGIVENIPGRSRQEKLNFHQAKEYFISALISATAINCHGAKVFIDCRGGQQERAALKHIISQTGEISGITYVSGKDHATVRLTSQICGTVWSLKLYSSQGKLIWSDRVELVNIQSAQGV